MLSKVYNCHEKAQTMDEILKMKAMFMRKNHKQADKDEPETIEISPTEAPEWMFFGYELSEWERSQARLGKGIWTQLELNEQASKAAQLVNDELEAAVQQLNEFLTAREKPPWMQRWKLGFDTGIRKQRMQAPNVKGARWHL